MAFYKDEVKNFRIAMAYDGHNILITDGDTKKVYPINEGEMILPTEMILNAIGASARCFVESKYTKWITNN